MHEFSHACSAWLLGDDTAKSQGRLSLNPLRHLDPAGTLLMLLAGFGWGKPVMFNPYNLRYGRLGIAITKAAGPLSNLAFAAVVALAIRGFGDYIPAAWQEVASAFLLRLLQLNVALFVFNLLPIEPLDGFGVVVGVLPWPIARPVARLGRYGPGILMLLIFLPFMIGIDVLGMVLRPLTVAILVPLAHLAGAR